MKSCKKGYYYCNTDEKCKPIPEGSMVKPDGMLVKKDVSEEKEKKDHEVSMAHKQQPFFHCHSQTKYASIY